MSPVAKIHKNGAASGADSQKPSSRSPWLLAAAIPLAGIGGWAVLSSGPEAAPPVPVVQTNPLPATAPVQMLGAAASDGSWQRGVVTQFSLAQPAPEYPTLQIDASRIETGRYRYPGDLVIAGDLQTPGVEITAGSITIEGSINANFVTLETLEQAPVQQDHKVMTIYGLDHREFLVAFEQHYPRGDISVRGDVTGDGIQLQGGQIAVAGHASGDIAIRGSAGEAARAVVKSDYYTTYTFPSTWADGVAAEAFTEQERRPVPVGDRITVTVGGTTGPDVRITQGFVEPAVAQNAVATHPATTLAPPPTHRP